MQRTLHGFVDHERRQKGFGCESEADVVTIRAPVRRSLAAQFAPGARSERDAAISRAATSVVMVRCASAGLSVDNPRGNARHGFRIASMPTSRPGAPW